jgi:hypothetical protein
MSGATLACELRSAQRFGPCDDTRSCRVATPCCRFCEEHPPQQTLRRSMMIKTCRMRSGVLRASDLGDHTLSRSHRVMAFVARQTCQGTRRSLWRAVRCAVGCGSLSFRVAPSIPRISKAVGSLPRARPRAPSLTSTHERRSRRVEPTLLVCQRSRRQRAMRRTRGERPPRRVSGATGNPIGHVFVP